MNAGIPTGMAVAASGRIGVDSSGARIASKVKRFLQTSRNEVSALVARGIADDAEQSVADAKKALAGNVKNANEGFETSMDDMFLSEGYAKSSGDYRREAIVRSTFFDFAQTETQTVGAYRWYAMPTLKLDVDLSRGRLQGLGAQAVMDLVGVAQKEVEFAQKKIFGEAKKLTSEEKKARGLLFEFTARDAVVTRELGEGEFGKHIGYAPEFAKEPDLGKALERNVVVEGSGELGRLMGSFVWSEMKEGRGWAEMALPAWDKPLWDDTGSWFKAPNLRTVGSIASGVTATVLTGGIGGIAGIAACAAVSTASTVVFDSLDVAYGYKTWEQAGLDIGKGFLTSAATSVVGAGFKWAGDSWARMSGAFGNVGNGVVGKTLLAGTQAFTTNVATSAINAIDLRGDWGISADKSAFLEGAFGKKALALVAGAAGSSAVANTLGGWNLNDGNGVALNDRVFNVKSVQRFNSLAGGLTSSAIQYGMTGEATFNVLRLAGEYEGRDWSSGLVEMHLGDSRSSGVNLGTNGTDVSYGAVAASASGLDATMKITEAKGAAMLGDLRSITTLNAVNLLGYTQAARNYDLAGDIWSGVKKVSYYDGSTSGINDQDLRALAYAEGFDTIGINSKLLGNDMESAAQIASLFAHEGMHLSGAGEIDAKIGGYGAYADLAQSFGVTGASYEETGIAWGAGMLQKLGAGAFGYVASAQITSEGKAAGMRLYEQPGETDLVKLAKVQLGSALLNTNKESDELWNYLVNSEDSEKALALFAGNETFSRFASGGLSSEKYVDAFALLKGLREALKDTKDTVASSVYSHDMLQYTTNVFRGGNGFDGISGALFMANLASGDGTARADNPFGYLVNDVARTYEGEYLNLSYDRSGSETGTEAGASYWTNTNIRASQYGNAVTGWYGAETGWRWRDTNGNVPSLDCVGYVTLVAYAAGALKEGQAYNQLDHKRPLGDWSKDYTSAREATLQGLTGVYQNQVLANWHYGVTEALADREASGQSRSGVYLAYHDSRITPVQSPQIGDLVFMGSSGNEHVGFYGVDDAGDNILIHSAPRIALEGTSYEAGPRENSLIDWTDRRANDKYSNMLVAGGYFTAWKDQFNKGYNFGRMKPLW